MNDEGIMEKLCLISAITGALTIFICFFLLYKKRIHIDKISSNQSLNDQAIKAEVLNILKISSNVPAIGLFILGLLLIVLSMVFYQNNQPLQIQPFVKYTVIGKIRKADNAPPRDINITRIHPVLRPSADGKIAGFYIWKDPEGKLPIFSFGNAEYDEVFIDPNIDTAMVQIDGDKIVLKNEIVLNRSE
jgi:hypothetical protein